MSWGRSGRLTGRSGQLLGWLVAGQRAGVASGGARTLKSGYLIINVRYTVTSAGRPALLLGRKPQSPPRRPLQGGVVTRDLRREREQGPPRLATP